MGGLDVPEARLLKVLADENAKVNKLLVEAMLDNAALKDLNSKKRLRFVAGGRLWLTFVRSEVDRLLFRRPPVVILGIAILIPDRDQKGPDYTKLSSPMGTPQGDGHHSHTPGPLFYPGQCLQ